MDGRQGRQSVAGGRVIIFAGVLWAVVYNLVWGAAWFGHMRREWLNAFAALGQPHPWTAEVWVVWGVFTVPLGIAMMAYAASSKRPRRRVFLACLIVWLLLAAGMAVWGITESLSPRVLALDALVNLVAVLLASFVGAEILEPVRPDVEDRRRRGFCAS